MPNNNKHTMNKEFKMGTNGDSLTPVVGVAQLREQEAASLLADLVTRKQQAEKQLNQLKDYLYEYENAHAEQRRESGVVVTRLNDERVFIQRLGHLIQKQSEEIARIDEMISSAVSDWQSTKIYNKTLQTLVEKYRSDEVQKEERRVQKESDELNTRKKYLM